MGSTPTAAVVVIIVGTYEREVCCVSNDHAQHCIPTNKGRRSGVRVWMGLDHVNICTARGPAKFMACQAHVACIYREHRYQYKGQQVQEAGVTCSWQSGKSNVQRRLSAARVGPPDKDQGCTEEGQVLVDAQ